MGRFRIKAMKCNFCGSRNNKIIYRYTRFERNNILKCERCGLVFLELKKTRKEIESFYKKEYRVIENLPKKSPEEMFNDPVTRQDCQNRIKWLKKIYGNLKGKKVMEIGSSSGYFLDVLSSAGAKVVGLELTDSYANYARKLGFTVYSQPLETLGLKNQFDLVVIFHTLEHIFSITSIIKAIYLSLKQKGVFMGEVPNQDDWRLKIFNNEIVKRFHYDPNHYYYFSPITLDNYLRKCGFNKILLETVERYNSLIQLRRILSGEYGQKNIERILRQDIFAKPRADVRIPNLNNRQESDFNRIFEIAVNSELMGNCLRWEANKRRTNLR